MTDATTPGAGDDQVLTPAAPRRAAHAVESPAAAGVDGYLVERLAGIDRLVRVVTDRLVALDQRLDGLEAKVDAVADQLDELATELQTIRRRLPLRAASPEAPSEAAVTPAPRRSRSRQS